MTKFWSDILTEKDGKTFELQRLFLFVSMWLSVLAFFWGAGLESWHVYKTGDFDMPSFFQAVAYLLVSETILLGGGAASIFFKSKTETTSTEEKIGR
jgi:hypothetical protein